MSHCLLMGNWTLKLESYIRFASTFWTSRHMYVASKHSGLFEIIQANVFTIIQNICFVIGLGNYISVWEIKEKKTYFKLFSFYDNNTPNRPPPQPLDHWLHFKLFDVLSAQQVNMVNMGKVFTHPNFIAWSSWISYECMLCQLILIGAYVIDAT